MGYLRPSPPREEIFTVLTLVGRASLPDGRDFRKSRLWVLEDRRVVLVVPGETSGTVERLELGQAVELQLTDRRSQEHKVIFGDLSEMNFRPARCNCGMGVVGSASITDDPWELVKVRRPDWYKDS